MISRNQHCHLPMQCSIAPYPACNSASLLVGSIPKTFAIKCPPPFNLATPFGIAVGQVGAGMGAYKPTRQLILTAMPLQMLKSDKGLATRLHQTHRNRYDVRDSVGLLLVYPLLPTKITVSKPTKHANYQTCSLNPSSLQKQKARLDTVSCQFVLAVLAPVMSWPQVLASIQHPVWR